METICAVLGCVLSFILGAYIRSPFLILQRRKESNQESKATMETSEETEQKERLKKQWENLLQFNGEEQAGETH